ncbi:MAG: hypothetical protein H3C60_14325 [Sphingomonadaceae bacterium]|nr:hypothetical protein [Sphingomonadaceae bacterium]
MVALPKLITVKQLIAKFEEFGMKVNDRGLRKIPRAVGACRILGKEMFFTEDDVRNLVEAMKPCPSSSTSAAVSGTTEAPLTGGGYAALLAQRTKRQRSASPPKRKRGRGNVISMDSAQR